MKKMFTLLSFVCLFLQLNGQDNFIEDMKAKWKNVSEYTVEFAEAMPENLYDYKPSKEEMSFAEQLIHICGNMIWLSGAYLSGKELDVDLSQPPSDKKSIVGIIQKCFEYTSETIANFDPKMLDDQVDFFAGEMSKRRVFFLLSDHVTHHKGQLVVYLRLNNIKPPRYRGW